jgi:hypothetical protein
MGGDQEMVTTDQQVLGRATVAQRWLARLGLVAAVAAVLVPLVAIGFRASVALVAVGLVGMGLAVAGLWWALTHRGVVRGLALGVFAVTVASAVQAAGLLRGTSSRGLTRLATPEVVIDADAAQIPVGVDGEALVLDTPVRCSIQPGVLRVRVPRNRPGVPDVTPQLNWKRLRQLALTGPGTGRAAPQDG